MARELARYTARDGSEITLSDDGIRRYLCDSENVTDKEVMLFAALCKSRGLNPFIREAYLVKFRDKPATMIVAKEVFVKRAASNQRFRGFEAGITVMTADRTRVLHRPGSMLMDGESLLGGWCRVHVDGYEIPMYDEVSMREYDKGRNSWLTMPATMIRKVAITHALREAFPDDLGGCYGAEEMGAEEHDTGDVELAASDGVVRETQPSAAYDQTDYIAKAEFVEVTQTQDDNDESYMEVF